MFLVFMVIEFTGNVCIPFYDFELTKDGFLRLLTGMPCLENPGIPPVPVKALSLKVSNFKGVNVRPLKADTIRIDAPIGPSVKQEILSRLSPKGEVYFEREFYKLTEFFPGGYFDYNIALGDDGDSTLELLLFPFRYNPGQSLLEHVSEFEVEVVGTRSVKGEAFPLYLVIAPSSFLNTLKPLLKWRRQQGLQVIIKTLEDIEREFSGVDLQEKVRKYIKTFSDLDGQKFLFLVGDNSIIPVRYIYAFDCMAGIHPDENQIPSDLYFSDIDGNFDANGNGIYGEVEDSVELYPDFFVGRLPVSDTSEVALYVSKVLEYERVAYDSLDGYLTDYAFIAQILWQNPYTDQSGHKNRIEEKYLPSYIKVDKFYESYGTASKAAVLQALNRGRHLINHDGHGWYDGMWLSRSEYIGISDVESFQNSGKYSLLYSIGCWVGALDYSSLAEEFVTVKNGAVGFIANSRYGWGSPGNPGFGYSDIYDDEFFNLFFEDKDARLGELFSNHKAVFAPLARDSNVYRWIYYELNLFGDPGMYVWRGMPRRMEIVSEQMLQEHLYELFICDNTIPLEGVYGTISYEDSVFSRACSQVDGRLTFDIPSSLCDSVFITLWKPGYLPFQKWVDLMSYNVFSFSITDSSGLVRDYLMYGRENFIKLCIRNTTSSVITDTFYFSVSGGVIIEPAEVKVTIGVYDSDYVYLNAFVPESLNVNRVEKFTIRTSSYVVDLPLKVAWPILSLEGYEWVDSSSLALRYLNSSLMTIEGRTIGAFDPYGIKVFQQVDPLSFGVDPGEKLIINVHELSRNTRRLNLFFDLDGMSYITDLALYRDSILFSEDFGNGLSWHGQTEYFELGDEGGIDGKYLTFNREYLPFSINAQIASNRFQVKGPFKVRFWFKYQFPIYGTTGVRVSVVKEHAAQRQVDTVTFIGAGGALEEKSISGEWALYEYYVNTDVGVDSAILILTFIKEAPDDAFWAIDKIEIVKASSVDLVGEGEGNYGFSELLNYTSVIRNDRFRSVIFSREAGALLVEFYDIAGRKVKEASFSLQEGFNEVSVPLGDLGKGVYFVKLLNETKKVVLIR
ncbi:MAG TPA: C25 family cysteine peptidase [Candidatus Hydrothermia bacterium]|nr:C25 family cysteine peptidase [Candidatus Hydrothermia bacterium]